MIQNSDIKDFHPAAASDPNTSTDRLDSWKEIATYLRREVRTVQLWEKHEGLPIHRHFHKRLGSVFAWRSELDHWKSQVSRAPQEHERVRKIVTSGKKFAPRLCPRERPASREQYLKGRYFWNQRNERSLRKAMQCFQSAICDDPEFALPYSGLADSLTLLSFYEIVPAKEAMPEARKAAKRAIELDPSAAEAHASLADVFFHFDRDWQSADREYRRAIRCNPEYALGYHWYANLLSARGQHDAANSAIIHALKINPVSVITLVWAGVTSHLARGFDEAIRHYQNALDLEPGFIWAHMYLAQSLEQKGEYEAALQEFDSAAQLSGGENHCIKAMTAHAHAVAGDPASAREILHKLGQARPRSMPSYDIAACYAALGDSHQVITWLTRACQERNMKVFALARDPRFDPLRRSSGFQRILAQVGLTQSFPT